MKNQLLSYLIKHEKYGCITRKMLKRLGYLYVLNTRNNKVHTINCTLIKSMKNFKVLRHNEAIKYTLSECDRCR